VDFLGSLRYSIMSSAHKDNLTTSSLFISFYLFLLSCSMNSSTILKKSKESVHPCLSPDFRGNDFSFFPTKYDIGYKYFIYTLLNVP
jgi:hypothetical protein